MSEVAQSCPTLCDPMDCSLPGSSIHGILQAGEYWSGLPFPSPGDLPEPGIELGSPTLQADTLPSEPPGKPIVLVKSITLWIIPWTERRAWWNGELVLWQTGQGKHPSSQ